MSSLSLQDQLTQWWNSKEWVKLEAFKVNHYCDHGVISDLSDHVNLEQQNEISAIYPSKTSFTFVTGSTEYKLTETEPIKDKWGNIATYDQDYISEGFYIWYYSDTSLTELEGDWEELLSADNADNFDLNEFVEFVFENHPDLVSKIEESTVCGGCANSWMKATTDKPFDSEEWIDVVNQYWEMVDDK